MPTQRIGGTPDDGSWKWIILTFCLAAAICLVAIIGTLGKGHFAPPTPATTPDPYVSNGSMLPSPPPSSRQ